jgi:hypothetical protein
LRVPDTSVQCERYGDRVAARKVRDWRVLHAASGDAEEYPSEKDHPSVGMYVIIGCSSRDEKRLLSLFYLEGFYDATQFASLPSL